MENWSSFEILTDRLRLTPLTLEHASAIFVEFDEEITTYMYPKPPETIEDTIAFIEQARRDLHQGIEVTAAILLRETGEFLGCAGLHRIQSATPELGLWLKKAAHGQHYGREAILGLIVWAETNLQFDFLVYPVDERNYPSRRIPESLNGRVARRYDKTNRAGRVLHLLEYHLYRQDAPQK